MDRRFVLAGLAAAVSTPVLAQATQQAPMSSGSMPAGGMQSGSMPAGQHQMGEAEMRHLRDTMMAGTVALETSRIALEKGRNADVKQYAKFEKDEQEGIAEVLKSMMDPSATASTSMQPQGEDAQMIQKLQGMQAGPEFDRMYVQGQIEGHQKLLRIQEEYLRQGRNREHVNVAKLARGHIKEHIEEFTELSKKLRA